MEQEEEIPVLEEPLALFKRQIFEKKIRADYIQFGQ